MRPSPGGYSDTSRLHVLSINRGEPAALQAASGASRLRLGVKLQYRFTQTGAKAHWNASAAAYKYTIETNDGREVLAYHWHPDANSPVVSPHVHLGSTVLRRDGVLGRRAHVPTGRVPLQQVIRLAIIDLGAAPIRPDWSEVLDRTEHEFQAERAW